MNDEPTTSLRRTAIPAAFLVGGLALGALFAPVGLAGAQEDDTEADSAESTELDETTEESSDDEGRRGRHGHRGRAFGIAGDTVEELTGLDRETIREGYEAGESLADQAEAAGVSTDALVDALVEAAEERVAEAVENGRLTQEEADERLADLEATITERVTTVPDLSERGSRGDCDDAEAEADSTADTDGEDTTTAA